MNVRKFYASDLAMIDVQPVQKDELATMPRFMAAAYEREGAPAVTIYDDDGIVACMGLFPIGESKAVAWAFMGRSAGKHLPYLFQFTAKHLDAAPFRRIEATVVAGFEPGHRWHRMLGYVLETPEGMKMYDGEGNTHYQYARVR